MPGQCGNPEVASEYVNMLAAVRVAAVVSEYVNVLKAVHVAAQVREAHVGYEYVNL